MTVLMQRTLIFLKPDAVEQGLEPFISSVLALRGLVVMRRKKMRLSARLARAHYAHHADKPFFPGLITYVTRGPVVVMMVGGENAIAAIRELVGATDPAKAAPDTLRHRFGQVMPDGRIENVVHASETPEEAEVEIRRFFGDDQSVWSRYFGWLWPWKGAVQPRL